MYVRVGVFLLMETIWVMMNIEHLFLNLPRLVKQHFITFLLACVGIFLSAGLFYLLESRQLHDKQEHFRWAVQEHFHVVSRIIASVEEPLEAIRSVLSDYNAVDWYAFRSFLRYKAEKTQQRLAWVPRVADAQRAAFELDVQRGFPDLPDYQLTERDSQGGLVRAAQRDHYFPIHGLPRKAGRF